MKQATDDFSFGDNGDDVFMVQMRERHLIMMISYMIEYNFIVYPIY